MLPTSIQELLLREAKTRFLRYVQINTQSDEHSHDHPSSSGQLDLGRMLVQELNALHIQDTTLDEYGYVYATLPASPGVTAPPITLCAHLDTSPSEPGQGVQPVLHDHYDGGVIRFERNQDLILSPEDSPELRTYIGQTIITAAGDTLLGADDKAGVAEILAAVAALQTWQDLPHPELRLVLTPDEEIGQGTTHIRLENLGKYGYTLDGGGIGTLEDECFDAFRATLTFHGINVHPGWAKNRMVNAAAIAARFVAALPEYDTPEHTEHREGFWHLTHIEGDENLAEMSCILRDFDQHHNRQRIDLLKHLIQAFELRYSGLRIDLDIQDQYRNMQEVLGQYPDVVHKAETAIDMAGVPVIKKAIRGGTDGARLSFRGLPTPNIFAGGFMFHSKKEWIPEIALQKASEVILHLCRLWAEGSAS
ncbi:peptidase T [candidate division KSB3 bacterium]|uniref:Peptidase T n=1 Tax=candidate division KSB3 bacterium TaxID=2044937 RepID=A0A9D5Q5Y9_9BACT|nr:peptidase T [candidate division KSB3 bacterium]MBD3325140.1 peptidase T [candidate division KSB3 bacterium]